MMVLRLMSEESDTKWTIKKMALERPAIAGDSPVSENGFALFVINLEYCPVRRLGRKPGGLDTQG